MHYFFLINFFFCIANNKDPLDNTKNLSSVLNTIIDD